MSSRYYYRSYKSDTDRSKTSTRDSHDNDFLDNVTEFNANQFKLYDDFTTDLRISFNPLRQNYVEVTTSDATRRRTTDPNDSGVDMENGNPLDDLTSKDSDLVSSL